jgi:membrane protease subunit (stomatin/prohibitin family)
MGAIGNMDAYMKFKTARAVGDAAAQPGGAAGETAQMGLGLGAGMAAARAMADAMATPQPAAPAAGGQPADNGPMQALQTLKQLLENGLISQEEYDAKRGDILSRL